jgi:hypothetical protein
LRRGGNQPFGRAEGMEEESGAPALTSPTAGSAIHEQISGHAAAAAGAITSTAAAVHSGLGLVATEIKDELFTSFKFWGAPTRGAFDRAWLTHKSPRGANCLERHRDGWLRFMLRFRKTFQYLTICSLITMITFAVIVTVAAFGTQMGFTMGEFTAYTVAACDIRQYNVSDVLYPQNYDPSAFCFGKDCPDGNPYTAAPKLLLQFVPRVRGHGVYTKATGDETGMGDYVAHYCTDAQFLFNVCVKFFTIWGTYFNVIPMPWTFSIFFHAWCPHAEAKGKLGVDFYGRPTKSIYFHTTHRNQKIVSTILTLALLDQIPDFIFIFIFPTYLDAGTWPGQFLTGIWFLVQIAMQCAAPHTHSARPPDRTPSVRLCRNAAPRRAVALGGPAAPARCRRPPRVCPCSRSERLRPWSRTAPRRTCALPTRASSRRASTSTSSARTRRGMRSTRRRLRARAACRASGSSGATSTRSKSSSLTSSRCVP